MHMKVTQHQPAGSETSNLRLACENGWLGNVGQLQDACFRTCSSEVHVEGSRAAANYHKHTIGTFTCQDATVLLTLSGLRRTVRSAALSVPRYSGVASARRTVSSAASKTSIFSCMEAFEAPDGFDRLCRSTPERASQSNAELHAARSTW